MQTYTEDEILAKYTYETAVVEGSKVSWCISVAVGL